jgi:hypothetical protein
MDNPPFILTLLVWLVSFGLSAQTTSAFSFNTSTPTQCRPLTIQWLVLKLKQRTESTDDRDGGQEPFQFLLVPVSSLLANRSDIESSDG